MSVAQDHSEEYTAPDPYTLPLETLDVSDSRLFETQQHFKYFERLRKEDPIHYLSLIHI